MPTNQVEEAYTADDIKAYVLRSDAIASCSVADAHSIPQALKDIEAYWLGTVPCRNVRLVGILISALEYESRSIYTIDDGTGSISCLKKRSTRLETEQLDEGSPLLAARGYNVGDTVSVIGKIEEYKGLRQIYVSSIERSISPDAESRHLLDLLELHHTTYSQRFVIPPLPIPSTPRKHKRPDSQPGYASSIASTPTTTSYSSPVRSPKKEQARLRHPSRLRSKDLNENVFRMYLSYVMVSTLSLQETPSEDRSASGSTTGTLDISTPRPPRTHSVAHSSNVTPKRPSHVPLDSTGSPTPKKQSGHSRDATEGPPLGLTLSYLRRVQVLAELAKRVVDQAAHERDKVLRHAERDARAKYELSNPPATHSSSSRPSDSRSGAKAPKLAMGSRSSHKVSTASQLATSSKHLQENSRSLQSEPTATGSKKYHSSSSSRPSNAQPTSSKSRSITLAPDEVDRRAAYHAKQAKLHAEDKQKRPARVKRLFESALRTLVSEGEFIVYDGPRRRVPTLPRSSGKNDLDLYDIWPDATNTTGNRTATTMTTAFSGISHSDLDTISEDDIDCIDPISEPSDSEDAYIPITPQTLRPAMLSALRKTLTHHRNGADAESWMKTLRGDGQWARIPDIAFNEAVDALRAEDWIVRVGGGRWDFTRGSWARSLKLS